MNRPAARAYHEVNRGWPAARGSEFRTAPHRPVAAAAARCDAPAGEAGNQRVPSA